MRNTRLTSFQKLALWTTATTYFLILVGGLVRASGAGLGCPDWPRCFGSWIPPASAASLPPQFDPAQFNPTLMWTEYLNRLLGVIVGFLIFATAILAWRNHRAQPRILWTTIAAFLLVGFEGWLGGRVVAHGLAAWIVTAHLIVAIVIVQLLLYATFEAVAGATGATGGTGATRAAIALIALTLVQAAFGTQVRGHVETAVNSGVARNAALATVGRLDYLHRDLAVLVLIAATLLTLWTMSRRSPLIQWCFVILGLAIGQILLGAMMAYVSLSPAAQVAHLTIASLLLGAETVLWLMSRRQIA
ncbi:MAG TPA: COX15/CtaA family protein [Vicinamibacterales bacterium]|nr:COX15/CtaA family protein [Vicinamibacterales bacterium]